MSLPPWIRSIKRPLETLVAVRSAFADLPDTEPGVDPEDDRIETVAPDTPAVHTPAVHTPPVHTPPVPAPAPGAPPKLR